VAKSPEPAKWATEVWRDTLPPTSRAGIIKRPQPRVPLRSTLGFMLPPAIAGSLKAFTQIARSQAVGKTLPEKREVNRLLHRVQAEKFSSPH